MISLPWAGFFALLGLRLAGTINSPWWVISAPLWGSLVLAVLVIVLWWAGVITAFGFLKHFERRRGL